VFFYKGLGHTKERCPEKKDSKPSVATNNYLEVLVDDGKNVEIQLDRIRYLKTTMICFCTLGFLCSGYTWTHLPDKHKIQSLPMKKWDGGEK
jgi:hypothetical protein